MGSLVQLGNVPEWLQAATGAASIYSAIRNRRQAQALEWAATFEELAGLDREELRRVIEENPAIAELVGLAWEAAAETANMDKRRLLAKVAAAALHGDTTPEQVEPLQFLLRTVIALDPPHITLLVAIGAKPDGSPRAVSKYTVEGLQYPDPEDWVRRMDMAPRWPSAPDLLDPAITALIHAGLIMEVPPPVGTHPEGWVLSPYGRRFLDHLLVDAGGWPTPSRTAGDGLVR